MRVKHLLIKFGPVQILRRLVLRQTMEGQRREMLGSLVNQAGPVEEDSLTTLGNRKLRVSAVFCWVYLRN